MGEKEDPEQEFLSVRDVRLRRRNDYSTGIDTIPKEALEAHARALGLTLIQLLTIRPIMTVTRKGSEITIALDFEERTP